MGHWRDLLGVYPAGHAQPRASGPPRGGPLRRSTPRHGTPTIAALRQIWDVLGPNFPRSGTRSRELVCRGARVGCSDGVDVACSTSRILSLMRMDRTARAEWAKGTLPPAPIPPQEGTLVYMSVDEGLELLTEEEALEPCCPAWRSVGSG